MATGVKRFGNLQYVIVFQPRDKIHSFYDRYTDKRYSHVYLMTKISQTQTLVIDPLCFSICHIIRNESLEDAIKSAIALGATRILRYNKRNKYTPGLNLRGIYNCVTLCKTVLNIKGFSFTPKQLYRYLLKLGATEEY